jgi:hypothetical protein
MKTLTESMTFQEMIEFLVRMATNTGMTDLQAYEYALMMLGVRS